MKIYLSKKVDTIQEWATLAAEYAVTHNKGKGKLQPPAQTPSNHEDAQGNSSGDTLDENAPALSKRPLFGLDVSIVGRWDTSQWPASSLRGKKYSTSDKQATGCDFGRQVEWNLCG